MKYSHSHIYLSLLVDDTESSVASGVDKRSAKEAAAREALELLGLAYIN